MISGLRKKTLELLRWSEQYSKTDMVYLARGGFWLSLGHVAASISSLILAVAFANLIPAETYGTYRYVLSIIGLLTIATFPGLNYVVITAAAKGNEASFWPLVKKKLKWSLFSIILSLVVSGYYFLQGNQILGTSFLVVALCLPLMNTAGLYASLLTGRKDFKKLTTWTIIARVLLTLSMLLALFITDSVIVFIAIYFVPEIVLRSLFLFTLSRKIANEGNASEPTDKLSTYGFHLSVMEILKTVADQIDKILVFHYLGAVELAIYAIATTAPGQIKSLMQNVTTLALPKFSDADPQSIRETLPQKLLRLELVIVLLIIGYWVVAPFVFPIIFPKYMEALLLSQVYALSLIFFPRTFLSTAMLAHQKTREMYSIRIWAPVLRIVIVVIALPLWGLWGLVIGSIVGNALTTFIYQYFFRKAFQS